MDKEKHDAICIKCGAIMRRGFIVEKDIAELFPAGISLYWKPVKHGKNVFKTAELIAYACPECGYVEQYVQDIEKDRENILHGRP